MKLIKKICIYIIVVLTSNNILAQSDKIRIKELFTIGNKLNDPKEYIFVLPKTIKVDSKNNFYVSDRNGTEVREFNSSGKFLHKYGLLGKGPGEFMDITSFCLNRNDNLVIFDRQLQRFTIINKINNSFKTLPTPGHILMEPYYMAQLNNGNYLLYDIDLVNKNNILFEVINGTFNYISQYFLSSYEVWKKDDSFLNEQKRLNSLNIDVLDSTQLIVSPKYYDGYIYHLIKENGKWQVNQMSGYIPPLKSYTLDNSLTSDEIVNNKLKAIILSGARGKYKAIINNTSAGVFFYERKYIINFILNNNNFGKGNLSLDVFNMQGKYLGNYIIKKFEKKDTPIFEYRVLCKDLEENFYLTDFENEIPVIRKIKLLMNF